MTNNKDIRVRFAPSPTGYMHVGNARAALFNWLFARRHGGTFILRIEDTDLERSEERFIEIIVDALKWLGLDWDEGPLLQSEQIERHREALDRMLASGDAYPCFETDEELKAMRDEAIREKREYHYDRRALSIPLDEAQRRIEAGEPHYYRIKTPDEGETVVNDLIRGDVVVKNSEIGDFVLMRPDGSPTFLFACAVDDKNMRISHVIRGEDHISNTPRQIMVMQALGHKPPIYAHLPLILGPDKARLSKRHGASSVGEYRDQGYLPEALMNFLALLGWSLDSETELLTSEELIANFSLERVNSAAAVFNQEKLTWMNGVYIRERTAPERIEALAREALTRAGFDLSQYSEADLNGMIELAKPRSDVLNDFALNLDFFFNDVSSYEEKSVKKIFRKGNASELLAAASQSLGETGEWTIPALEEQLRRLVEEKEVGFGKIAQPLRLALTGRSASPGIFDVLYYLGRERTVQRIARAIEFIAALPPNEA